MQLKNESNKVAQSMPNTLALKKNDESNADATSKYKKHSLYILEDNGFDLRSELLPIRALGSNCKPSSVSCSNSAVFN